MLFIGLENTSLQVHELPRVQHPFVGGIVLFARNYADDGQLRALCADIRRHAPHLLICVDHEGGRVQRFRNPPFTLLPEAAAFGRIANDTLALALAEACGCIMAYELRTHGVDFPLAPVLDLQDDCSSVIGNRAYHHDPALVSRLSIALRRGLSQQGMAAVGKHYPGHGRVHGDSHHMLPCDPRPGNERGDDRAPFLANIADGIEGIMTAHILLPEDTLPAGFSRHCLQGLRDSGFDGVIFSDDLDMQGALRISACPAERVQMALSAGADAAMICNRFADIDAVLATHPAPDASRKARLTRLRPRPPADDALSRYQAAQALFAEHHALLYGATHG